MVKVRKGSYGVSTRRILWGKYEKDPMVKVRKGSYGESTKTEKDPKVKVRKDGIESKSTTRGGYDILWQC